MTRLLDIASYQSVTDAAAVARTDVEGVWVKLTGENFYTNPKRGQQVDSLRGTGLGVGGYHFGDPRISAVDQARAFGNDAKARGLLDEGALFPMFDAENSAGVFAWQNPAQLNAHIMTWRDVLRGEYGVTDFLVYGSESWFTDKWINPDVWGDDHAWNWVANYNGRPGVLTLGWSHPQDAIHQWRSDAVPFPGISANGLDDNVTLRGHTRESLTIGDNDMAVSQEAFDNLVGKVDRLLDLFQVSEKGLVVGGGPGTPETVQDTVQRGITLTQTCHDDIVQKLEGLQLGDVSDVRLDDAVQRGTADFVRKGERISIVDGDSQNGT